MKAFRVTRQAGTVLAAGLFLAMAASAQDQAQVCGTLENHYGPYDYRTQRNKLLVVEKYHFTPSVEALTRGASTTKLAGDISYLMQTSPNHHRGLVAVMRLSEKEKSPHPKNLRYSVECYFDRAIRFQNDDTTVRMLYAQYLHKQNRTPEAVAQLQIATNLAKDNGFTNYNIGMVYFEIGKYDQALVQAHKAKSLGFNETELMQQLKSKNAWKEPAN